MKCPGEASEQAHEIRALSIELFYPIELIYGHIFAGFGERKVQYGLSWHMDVFLPHVSCIWAAPVIYLFTK